MLAAIKSVLPALGKKKLSAFLVVRAGTVTAFDGVQVLTAPINTDLEFAPKGHAFARAIKKCGKETIALWVNNEGNVMVHSDSFDATVECEPLEKFPMQIQTGFWFDVPRVKKPPVPKCVPPEPVWLRPDYLPGLEEARAFNVPRFTWQEFVAAVIARETMICDVEIFKNYFCVAFCSVVSGKVFYFEMIYAEVWDSDEFHCTDPLHQWGLVDLEWVLKHALLVTFNGNFFDLPILALALAGWSCARLKWAADEIISERIKPWQVLKSAKVKKLSGLNHIDLIEVCPLDGSLKLYGGRLHVPRMQDLPFPHDAVLSQDQITIVRFYCVNDLTTTAFCYVGLREQIELRAVMGERYGMDLRSKSDAQIAEAVISGEIQRLTYAEPERPHVPPGTRYRYKTPAFVSFRSPLLQWVLATVQGWEFVVSETGYVEIPINPETGKTWDLKIKINGGTYTLGMGGLHSSEESVCHMAGPDWLICDRDVASYYPAIMLNLELYPSHLGPAFLQVFRSIVQRRLEAKKNKQKVEAETLKIVVNGTFGHTSNKWSRFYSPDLTLAITVTGQLCLLMLIERLELAGIQVCSANTDGIVFKMPKDRKAEADAIVAQWENETNFKTEETQYVAIYSRDVNNYIAVKPDGKTKTKGAFFNPWSSDEYKYERYKKNPQVAICIEAVTEFLTKRTPLAQTIRTATDPRKFVSIRTVRGGAVKNGVYLGKAVRWYYAAGETGAIVYALSGKQVAQTEGARPCMDLPTCVPADVDFAWYEHEAAEILKQIGLVQT